MVKRICLSYQVTKTIVTFKLNKILNKWTLIGSSVRSIKFRSRYNKIGKAATTTPKITLLLLETSINSNKQMKKTRTPKKLSEFYQSNCLSTKKLCKIWTYLRRSIGLRSELLYLWGQRSPQIMIIYKVQDHPRISAKARSPATLESR